MTAQKLWLIGENGRPLGMQHAGGGAYKEPLSIVMAFTNARHHLDLTAQDSVEDLAPYHFRTKAPLLVLMGISIGIAVGGMMNLEPLVAAIVVATFAVNSLLFQSGLPSEFRLLRASSRDGIVCLVARDEDLEWIKGLTGDRWTQSPDATPKGLDQSETAQVDAIRYGFVAATSALTALALIRPLTRAIEDEGDTMIAVSTAIVFAIALAISYIGALRVVLRMAKIKRGQGTAPKRG